MLHKRWRLVLPLAGLLALIAVFGACGGDDDGGGSDADKQEVSDVILQVANATPEDFDIYAEHVTDAFLQTFGTESLEECEADTEECIGEPLPNPSVDLDSVEIDGDTATLTLSSDDGIFGIKMIKEEDVWKANGFFAVSDEVPEGVETVDLELVEFAFVFESDSDLVKSGDFAFHVTNGGEQTHQVSLVKIPEDADIDVLLESEESEGIEDITFKFPFNPGDEADMAVPQLEPGRYLLICFLPDTTDDERTPHAFKGMRAEFTVE